jgi:GT2 family glycosyltransferase/glycosyltransferase involved in cell wall biosynthesis
LATKGNQPSEENLRCKSWQTIEGKSREIATRPRASVRKNSSNGFPMDKPVKQLLDTITRPIALVIVTFNSAKVIEGCLAALPSALHDAGKSKVIVVDNASTDDTLERVAAAMPSADIVRRRENGGFAAGVNDGFKAAAECDILVLNPDIRLAAGSIAALRVAAKTSRAGIVVPRLVGVDGELLMSLHRRPTVARAFIKAFIGGTRASRIGALGGTIGDLDAYERSQFIDWASGAAWLVTRECIDTVGLLDERYFLYHEETEYMLRAADTGLRVYYEPGAVAVHLGGESQSSPPLAALLAANQVRFHRERRGRVAGVFMWLATVCNEGLRVFHGSTVAKVCHRAALRELLTMHTWPKSLSSGVPSYLCFAAQDWWYHNRAHSDFQLMRRVAEHRTVLVVNSIGMRMPLPGRSTQFARRILRKARSIAMLVRRPLPDVPGLHVMSPVPFPFYRRAWQRWISARLIHVQVRIACLALKIRAPVVVVTIPTAWDAVRSMRKRTLAYNRSDLHSAFSEANQTAIRTLEHCLLSNADHVLYASRALQKAERHLVGGRGHFLDHGVDIEHFRRRQQHELPADLVAIPRPRVGFFGSLDDLVDFDLLERVAAELPDVSLVLIGHATCSMDRFHKYPNVFLLGFRPYELIPAYGSGFDVALMPWVNSDWIRYANPIKLKEYLALGLPVVTTHFLEASGWREVISVAADHAEFVKLIRDSVGGRGPGTPAIRRQSVLTASWKSRAAELMAIVEGTVVDGTKCAE